MWQCINFGNGNDRVGMERTGSGNTENHSCTPLVMNSLLDLQLNKTEFQTAGALSR